MAKYKIKGKQVNVPRVVAKIVGMILALYVGGTILSEIGDVVVNSSSPFYQGLTLIGWTVGPTGTNGTAGCFYSCSQTPVPACGLTTSTTSTCITSTSGSGILAVIGIIGIASIVMEFVEFRMG